MLLTKSQLSQLERELAAGPSGLRTASTSVECDPLALVRAGAPLFGQSTYFRTPDGDEFASLGVAVRFSTAGNERFANLEAELAMLPTMADGARLTLGFSFSPQGPSQPEWDGFGACDVSLPKITVVKTGSDAKLVVAVPAGSDPAVTIDILADLHRFDDPPPPDPGVHTVESVPSTIQWQSEVAEAVGAIRDGSLDKVVLARSVQVHSERPTDPFGLVHHLGLANPSCYIYAMVVGESA
ncbi:MAG: chorismate-binding protein, partial [Actinomycetota bacterium]|nr:chorismate-binding protein [Actinomycetota bacterium]